MKPLFHTKNSLTKIPHTTWGLMPLTLRSLKIAWSLAHVFNHARVSSLVSTIIRVWVISINLKLFSLNWNYLVTPFCLRNFAYFPSCSKNTYSSRKSCYRPPGFNKQTAKIFSRYPTSVRLVGQAIPRLDEPCIHVQFKARCFNLDKVYECPE